MVNWRQWFCVCTSLANLLNIGIYWFHSSRFGLITIEVKLKVTSQWTPLRNSVKMTENSVHKGVHNISFTFYYVLMWYALPEVLIDLQWFDQFKLVTQTNRWRSCSNNLTSLLLENAYNWRNWVRQYSVPCFFKALTPKIFLEFLYNLFLKYQCESGWIPKARINTWYTT